MMIKQKLQSAWEWTKDKARRTWAWTRSKWREIVIVMTLGTALGAPLLFPNYPAEYVTAPENNTYKIGVQNYDAVLASDITANQPLKYQLDDKFISFKPTEIRWDDSSFKTILPKQAKINEKSYLYEDAFGEGIDIDMNFGDRVFEKIVKIESLESLGEIPADIKYLEIEFEVETNLVIDGWNKRDDFEITDTIRLGDYSYLEPAMAWDSYREEVCQPVEEEGDEPVCETLTNRIQIRSVLSQQGNKLYLTKYVPMDWLKDAQYPIYTDLDIAYGTPQEFEDGTDGHTTRWTSVTELDSNKFVVCWHNGGGFNAECRVGTVSSATITWGAISVSANIGAASGATKLSACKLDTDKFVTVTGKPTTGFYAQATTVSTRTIAEPWGTQATLDAGDVEYVDCSQLTTDKFVACYNDETDSDTGKCGAHTVSGTTITVGSETAIDGNSGATKDYYPKYGDTAQLGTDKFIYCFEEEETDDDSMCGVGTVSTRTITLGTFTDVAGETVNGVFQGVDSQGTDKFVVTYEDNVAGDGEMAGGSVSTRTITYGGVDVFFDGTSGTEHNRVVAIDSTHVVVVYNDADASAGTSMYTVVTDATPPETTPGDLEAFEGNIGGGATDLAIDADLISADKIVICYQDDADADKGKCIIGDTPSAAPAARRIFIVD